MKTLALGILGLTLVASLALAQGRAEGRTRAGEPRSSAQGEAGVRGDDARVHRRLRARAFARGRAREFVRGLELDDAQRALAREQAARIAPTARALRAEGRAILEQARARVRDGSATPEVARADARRALVELRERARAELAPYGRPLVDALTAEQRARIDARLAERGRTFDAERASERVGRALARPRAARRAGEAGAKRDER